MLEKIDVESMSNRPASYKNQTPVQMRSENLIQRTQKMLVVNEIGIYEALFASRRLEARKFRIWAGSVLQRLRQNIGLKQYDPESDQLMCSVTVQGGDVDVRPFDKVYKEQE